LSPLSSPPVKGKIEGVYKKLDKFCKPKAGKIRILIESAKWPFKKDECQQIVEELHRFGQTFSFSLTVSNW
jgi:hypothetical protein